MPRPALPLLLAALAPTLSVPALAQCTTLTDDMLITQDTVICPGTYAFDDPTEDGVIRIGASDVTLTLTGVTLQGSQMTGYGILCDGYHDVEIVGGTISGYRSAILMKNGGGHRIAGALLSGNRKRPVTNGPGDFLAVWPDWAGQLANDQIGNGIVLVGISTAVIEDNVCQDQQNGIGLYQCDHVELFGNDCSDNEGWGVHLTRSSHNVLVGNRADNCFNKVSTYCSQVQDDGCDTAALLLIKDSNHNRVAFNSLRNSGDGVFSAAQEGSVHWGADFNVYWGNDTGQAKHIGIESTFSAGNVFVENLCEDAGRYGMWLGYSTDALVRRNLIRRCAFAGILNESTVGVRYERNVITENLGHGVHLRRGTFWALAQGSRDQRFTHNKIRSNGGNGIHATDTHLLTVRRNDLGPNAGGNLFLGAVQETAIDGPLAVNENNVLGLHGVPYNVRNEQPTEVDLTLNWWDTVEVPRIATTIHGLDLMGVVPPHRLPRLEIEYTLGSEGPYPLARVANERAADATDCSAANAPGCGNRSERTRLGRVPGVGDYVTGFHFRDLYLDGSATLVSARLVLPTEPTTGTTLDLVVRAEAADDPSPFETFSMPLTRSPGSQAVTWTVSGDWVTDGWATSPDLTPLLQEVLARPGWLRGNDLVLLVSDAGSSDGIRETQAFDLTGYDQPAGSWEEFRRYRLHRQTVLDLAWTTPSGASMGLERQVASGADDADDCLTCNEVHLGWIGHPLVAGVRFEEVSLPDPAWLTSAHLILATDGTYTNTMDLELYGELLLDPGPYASGDLPKHRAETSASVPWTFSDVWHYTEWHPTPDLIPLVTEISAQPGWIPGNALALHLRNVSGSEHRRIWAFDRDPRVSEHDFPEIGATPFLPIQNGPLNN